MYRERRADARVGAAQLFEKEAVREEVGPGPAVLLGHAQAHKARVGHLFQRLEGDPVFPVEFGRVGRYLPVGELCRALFDLLLFRAQAEVHGTSVV